MTPADDELRKQARKRLEKRRDFTAHLVTYVIVNAMLIGLWAISGAGYFWPAWVLLGWGVGLALNAWDVFFRRPITERPLGACSATTPPRTTTTIASRRATAKPPPNGPFSPTALHRGARPIVAVRHGAGGAG